MNNSSSEKEYFYLYGLDSQKLSYAKPDAIVMLSKLILEIEEAQKFDDLVFAYTQGSKKAYRFLQAKHTQAEDSRKIEVGDLLTQNKNGEFRLAKYFISYLKIKNNQDFADGNLKDFIICTNIDFDLDQSTAQNTVKKLKVKTSGPNNEIEILVEVIDTSDVFFKDGGTRYKFSCIHNNMISVVQPAFESAVEETIAELEKEIEKLQSTSDQDSKRKLGRNQKWQNEFKQIIKSLMSQTLIDRVLLSITETPAT